MEKERTEKELKEWRKKVHEKVRKTQIRKENREKQKILSERWAMLRWVTQYINENKGNWEKLIIEKEIEIEK